MKGRRKADLQVFGGKANTDQLAQVAQLILCNTADQRDLPGLEALLKAIGCSKMRGKPQAKLDDMQGHRRQRDLIQCSSTECAICTALPLECRWSNPGQNNRRCKCLNARPFPGMDVPGLMKTSEHIGGKTGPGWCGISQHRGILCAIAHRSRKQRSRVDETSIRPRAAAVATGPEGFTRPCGSFE